MTFHLRELWVASAQVENLAVKLDQAAHERNIAMIEAIRAGHSLNQVAAAANLSMTEAARIALGPGNTLDEAAPAASSVEAKLV